MGLVVLACIVAAVVGLVAFGGDDADDAVAAEPQVTPTAQPEDDSDPDTSGSTGPLPTAFPTAEPTTVGYPELGATVKALDMGTGWMVTADRTRQSVLAINLETGEIVTVPRATKSGQPTFVFREGVLRSESIVSETWRLLPWADAQQTETGAAPGEVVTIPGGQVLGAFVDKDVGPVVVSFDFTDDPALLATAVNLNVSQTIESADQANLFRQLFLAPLQGVQSAHGALWIDDGTAAYTWSWADGWVRVADGRLLFDGPHGAALIRCTSPTDCPGIVVNFDGAQLATFASGAFPLTSVFDNPSLSPDLTRVVAAEASFSAAQPTLIVTDLASGDTQRFENAGSQWRQLKTWTPNGRYLVVGANEQGGAFSATSSRSFVALDTETGDVLRLDEATDPLTSGVVFLPEIDQP